MFVASKCFRVSNEEVNVKRAAFTLAEVLITLGIIGVVAAMTMPTLVANIQDKVLGNQHSKAKNILANGYKKMLADNEVFELEHTPLNTCITYDCIDAEHLKVFKTVKSGVGLTGLNLPAKYQDKDGKEFDMVWSNKYVFVTPDGYVYALDVEKFLANREYNIYADINGAKRPAKEKKDLILYTVFNNGTVTEADIKANQCSPTNLGACNEEQCRAIPSRFEAGCTTTYWWTGTRCDDTMIQCG